MNKDDLNKDDSSSDEDVFFDAIGEDEQEQEQENIELKQEAITGNQYEDAKKGVKRGESSSKLNSSKIKTIKKSLSRTGSKEPEKSGPSIKASSKTSKKENGAAELNSSSAVSEDDKKKLAKTLVKNLENGELPLGDAVLEKNAFESIIEQRKDRQDNSSCSTNDLDSSLNTSAAENKLDCNPSPSQSNSSKGRRTLFSKKPKTNLESPRGIRNISKTHGDFQYLTKVQKLSAGNSAILTMKFSFCGKLLATSGQDYVVSVWCVRGHEAYFDSMKNNYNSKEKTKNEARLTQSISSPSDPLFERETSHISNRSTRSMHSSSSYSSYANKDIPPVFLSEPYAQFHGHTNDVIDLSWSTNNFLISCSIDNTVRLWHISQKEVLCCFQHPDFVASIAFHPKDNNYFISASLDSKIRLWNIPLRKVSCWHEIHSGYGVITCANFCRRGEIVVVGTNEGRCLFYNSEDLKYHTQILIKRTGKRRGKKISGLVPVEGNKILVTSNDSRIWMYDLNDFSLSMKFKGAQINSSLIRANISADSSYIICASEDSKNCYFYIWSLKTPKQNNTKRDIVRNLRRVGESCEVFNAHDASVSVATFAPVSTCPGFKANATLPGEGEVIVTADVRGNILVMVNLS